MIVLDNVLEVNIFNKLKSLILGANFPWYFSNEKVCKNNKLYNYQFVHVFFSNNNINSSFFHELNDLYNILKTHTIIRVKANLTTHNKKVIPYDFHTDIPALDKKKYKTAIFYLTSTDGPSLFKLNKKMEKVECVENRLVIFDGNIEHTGSTHTNTKARVVINFNYFESD
jgi:hypothetical protein